METHLPFVLGGRFLKTVFLTFPLADITQEKGLWNEWRHVIGSACGAAMGSQRSTEGTRQGLAQRRTVSLPSRSMNVWQGPQ